MLGTITAAVYPERTVFYVPAVDMAFNVEVKDAEKPANVVVTATLSTGVEVVLFETTLQPAAQQSISFTAYMLEAGTYECTLYVGGEKVKSMNYEFALR